MNEQSAIQDFLSCLSTWSINRVYGEYENPDIEDWICAIASAEDDMQRYLDDWLNADSTPAHLNLAMIIGVRSSRFVLDNPFWRALQREQVLNWLIHGAVKVKLTTFLDLDRSPSATDIVHEALVRLDVLSREFSTN